MFKMETLMRPLLLLTAVMIFAAPALAETKTYDIRDFSKLKIDTAYEVEFTQGPNWSVSVDSEYNNLDKIIVEKKGDTLVIHRPDGQMHQRNIHDVVRITAPRLTEIDVNTAVKFTATRLDAPSLTIDAHTAANLDIEDLHAENLTIHGDAAASLMLAGECGKLTLDISSGSKADARALKCREVKVDADAASSARVFASTTMDAEANSASSIRVSGKPANIKQHKDMVSTITLID
jgi:hypothetical protein